MVIVLNETYFIVCLYLCCRLRLMYQERRIVIH